MRHFRAFAAAFLAFALISTEAAHAQSLLELLFGPRTGTAPGLQAPPPNQVAPQGALCPEMVSRSRQVPWQFRRQTVSYSTREAPGTIVIDPRQHFLYFVLGNGRAVRYGVGVGRDGFGWHGAVNVGRKAEWPAWHPPKEMIAREAKRGRKLPVRMEGGLNNPLGARALYLHNARGADTLYRIHGTNEPWTIGLNVSSGCIRMVNDDVVDLYSRVQIGAKVVVL